MNIITALSKSISIRDSKPFYSTFGSYYDNHRDPETGYVAACLNTMGNYFSKSKLRLYRNGESLKEITNHPFLDLLRTPNNFQTSWEQKYFMGVYFGVKGNFYLLVLKGLISDQPRQLIMLDPMRVTPKASKSEWISHYEYNKGTEKIRLERDEVLHFRYPYSGSVVLGSPIIDTIKDIVEVDKYQQAYMKKFYKEGGFLGGVFTTTATMTNTSFDRAYNQLKKQYSGSENAFKVALFEQGLQPIKAAYSIKDMELTPQRKLTQEETLMAFRIPKLLLGGTAEGYTKASSEAAEYTYASTMIDPLLSYNDEVWTKFVNLYYPGNLIAKHDSVAPKDVERNLAYYKGMMSMGALTINEVRTAEDYDPLPYKLADTSLLNVGGAAIDISNGEQLGQVPNNVPPTPNKSIEKDFNELHWKQYSRRFDREYKFFKREVSDFFDEQQKRLENKLNQKNIFTVEDFFNSQDELLILMNMIENALNRFIERGMSFGGKTDLSTAFLRNGKAQIMNNIKSVNETSKKEIVDKVRKGDDSKIMEIIKESFETFRNSRSDLISQTTVESGFNLGLWASYKLQGFTQKIWVTQMDSKVRDSHTLANGQRVGIDEMFVVGSEFLMYPGDPTASVDEIANCRCVILGEK